MANNTTSIEDLLKKARAANAAKQPPADPTKQASASKAAKPSAPAVAPTQAKLQETMGNVRLGEKERETAEKAASTGLPYIQLRGFPIAPEALSLLTRDVATTLNAVIFFLVGDEIRIGTTNPTKEVQRMAERVAKERHANVSTYLISEDSLGYALKLYDKLPTPKEVIYGYRIEEEDLAKYEKEIGNLEDLQKKIG
ncbi:hypothetical protein IT087_04465, partial [Candidatus Uhrbacteria bacterium]|nr:hypothetical protein [Candidatus Uhrbacteria bacterium]